MPRGSSFLTFATKQVGRNPLPAIRFSRYFRPPLYELQNRSPRKISVQQHAC